MGFYYRHIASFGGRRSFLSGQQISEIQIYKERSTTRRFRIYQAEEFTPVPSDGLKLNSVISDM